MNWSAFIVLFFVASTKFLFAPSLGLYYFSFWETIIYVSIGGIAGVTFFFFTAEWLIKFSNKRKRRKQEEARKKGIVLNKKVFTPFRRRVIRIKRSFGLIGIAIVTPCIISIPIGSILAARFYHHKNQAVWILYLSVIAWAFILTIGNDLVVSLFRYLQL